MKCPAYGKACRQCGKANHFHTICLQGKGKADTYTKHISVVQESQSEETESEDELFAVEQIGTVNHNHKGQFFVPLSFDHELSSTISDCQLDTGATCNVMRLEDVCAIKNPPLQPRSLTAEML